VGEAQGANSAQDAVYQTAALGASRERGQRVGSGNEPISLNRLVRRRPCQLFAGAYHSQLVACIDVFSSIAPIFP
jgi:hypothetical protein